uniref:Photosystem II reaction center protein Z n=1 Tax=Boodleopsis sp. H.0758 TaxID=2320802 RepID=A0A386AZT3_9CHLO|nr:photosystem II protein Z [Boodleopsis sp. H.0758]AYC64956.1 photosystem II protein Z [Boodleopsis sp. H.0758]
MDSIFKILILFFILFSFLLVIGVPIVFSYDSSSTINIEQYKKNRSILFTFVSIWFILVFTLGIFNSFIV